MADLGTTTAAPDQAGDERPEGRLVTRRRGLPGGRAVVGALLVTVAVIGVFAAWLQATSAPTTSYVVVAGDVAAGEELTADLLETVPIDLPPEQAARVWTNPAELDESVALAPMAPGDLVTRSMVIPASDASGRSLYTFELPVARALGGEFDPGDRVDVIGTADGRTGFVARSLEVIRGTIESGMVTVTVAVDDPDRLVILANAVDVAQLHLVLADPTVDPDDVAGGGGTTLADDPFVDTPPGSPFQDPTSVDPGAGSDPDTNADAQPDSSRAAEPDSAPSDGPATEPGSAPGTRAGTGVDIETGSGPGAAAEPSAAPIGGG